MNGPPEVLNRRERSKQRGNPGSSLLPQLSAVKFPAWWVQVNQNAMNDLCSSVFICGVHPWAWPAAGRNATCNGSRCNQMINYLMQNVTLAGPTVAWRDRAAREPDATSSHGACNRLVRNPVQKVASPIEAGKNVSDARLRSRREVSWL